MRFFCLLVLAVMPSLSGAQTILTPPPNVPYDAEAKLIVYTKVFDLPGMNPSEVLSVGKRYYIEKMGGKTKDIELEDKENNYLMFKAQSYLQSKGFLIFSTPSLIMYDVELRAKEGRAKITITPRRWVTYKDDTYQQLIDNVSIPFYVAEGMFAKSFNKDSVVRYGEIDAYYTDYLTRFTAFMQQEAEKFKKSKDF